MAVFGLAAVAHPSSFMLHPSPSAAEPALKVLPNGLRLLTREQHQAPLVAIDVWVRAGSAHEGPGEAGAAHFVEHLLFKGTATRKPGEIDEAIEDLGATLSAGTARDGAHFYTTVPSAYWQRALEVIADALRNAAFRPEDVERERAVILDELALARGDLRREAAERLYETGFTGHPYAHRPSGLAEDIRSCRRDSVVGFWRRLYVPANVTVALVGDLKPGDAEDTVQRVLGDWQGGPAAPPLPAVGADSAPQAPAANGPAAMVAEGCRRTPALQPAEVCASDMLAILLGDPQRGALARSLADRGIATEVGAQFTPLGQAGMLVVWAAPAPGRKLGDDHAAEARAALSAELQRLQAGPVPASELEWARRQALASWLYDAETFGGQARALGSWDCLGSYRTAVDYPGLLAHVTAADVQECARKWLDPAHRVTVALPQEGAK